MLREEIPRRAYTGVMIAVFGALIGLWCILSYGHFASKVFLPTPTDVLRAGVTLYNSGDFLADLYKSNLRILGGFFLATLVSIPLGMLVGNFRVAEAAIEPFMGFIRYMPVPAFIPLIILYTGIDESAKILVIFIGTAVQMIGMVADVTKQTSAELCKAALTLGARPNEILRKVVWRASLPGIVDVCRTNLGWAWTYLIVAEVLAANQGLGLRIIKAQRFMSTDVIFFYLFVIGLLGLACDWSFKLIHRWSFPWAQERMRA